ncbi:MAG TPA: ASCH domain-containing protein [Pyrinomonadaceae bacterium]|jgi:predicted transcriptional regulator
MQEKTLLLSLRPTFADLVFAGVKTVELRRSRPRVRDDDWALVYVSTPIKAVVGVIQVAAIIENKPSTLWRKVRKRAGITRRQFDEYYVGAPMAYGIVLNAVERFRKPVELNHIREVWPDFQPPQSYRYLDMRQRRLIRR